MVAAVLIAALVPLSAYLRRPKLTLHGDVRREYSTIVGDVEPRIRLVVKNARRKRAAHGARVELVGYRTRDAANFEWLGNRPLTWMGTLDAAVTVFSGAERAIGLGALFHEPPRGWQPPPGTSPATDPPRGFDAAKRWHLHLDFHGGGGAPLPPGAWVFRILVGAEEGDAATCEVEVAWDGNSDGANAAFESVQVLVRDVR